MHKRYSFLFFLFSTVFLLSCTPALKLYYGIHKPKLETAKSVSSYAQRIGMGTDIILIPKDSASFMEIFMRLQRTPELYLYDKEGKPLSYSLNESCNAPVFEFTKNICEGKYFKMDSALSLSSLFEQLRPLRSDDSLRFVSMKSDSAKYSAFLAWKKYNGRLNKDHIVDWQKNLHANADCESNTFLLNLDFIEGVWSKEQFAYLEFNEGD